MCPLELYWNVGRRSEIPISELLGERMGSEFDEVAKAVAKNMPRRKVLKLFAGGVAAAVGSALLGSAASAKSPFQQPVSINVAGQCFINSGNFGNGPGSIYTDCPPTPWSGRNPGHVYFNGNFGPL